MDLDKLLHVIAYGIITWLTLAAVNYRNTWPVKVSILLIMLFVGAIDEYTQEFIGRSCRLDDWMADIIGIILVLAFIRNKVQKN